MLTPELVKKIEKIFIRGRMKANSVFSGEFRSAFRGHGMEFEEYRDYIPGDDIRSIDWNVSARMNKPYVKIFREEREQTIMLLVDASQSLNFGSLDNLKKDVVTELASILAFAATNSNDKIGLILFSDRVEKFISPKKGRAHVWLLIKELMTFKPQGSKTDIKTALEFFDKVVPKRCVAFLISDFLSQGYQKALKVSALQHDLTLLHISDPAEQELAEGALMLFRDLESGQVKMVDFGSLKVRQHYAQKNKERMHGFKKLCEQSRVDVLFLTTASNHVDALIGLFRIREKRIVPWS